MTDVTDHIAHQAFDLLAGTLLGEGMTRKVFACKHDPRFVVKCETGSGHFQNIVEYETWRRVEGTACEKWFAPVLSISPVGSVLIMRRTTPPAEIEYPTTLPYFLTDTKRRNYGMVDGRFVCHDYGTNLLFEHGMTKRMKRASWTNNE